MQRHLVSLSSALLKVSSKQYNLLRSPLLPRFHLFHCFLLLLQLINSCSFLLIPCFLCLSLPLCLSEHLGSETFIHQQHVSYSTLSAQQGAKDVQTKGTRARTRLVIVAEEKTPSSQAIGDTFRLAFSCSFKCWLQWSSAGDAAGCSS
jgi:hypothetical protein